MPRRNNRLYELLETRADASSKGLKLSYRRIRERLAAKSQRGDTWAADRLEEVEEAYAVLSDPTRRGLYDRFGNASLAPGFVPPQPPPPTQPAPAPGPGDGPSHAPPSGPPTGQADPPPGPPWNNPMGSALQGSGAPEPMGGMPPAGRPASWGERRETVDLPPHLAPRPPTDRGPIRPPPPPQQRRKAAKPAAKHAKPADIIDVDAEVVEEDHVAYWTRDDAGENAPTPTAPPPAPVDVDEVEVEHVEVEDIEVEDVEVEGEDVEPTEPADAPGATTDTAAEEPEPTPRPDGYTGDATDTARARVVDGQLEVEVPFRLACLGGTASIAIGAEEFELTIPVGTADGDLTEIDDVPILFRVEGDEVLERRGFDLYTTIRLELGQVLRGVDLSVPTLDGRANFRVPRSARSGQTLRIAGRGVPRPDGDPGHLMVTLQIDGEDKPRVRGFSLTGENS